MASGVARREPASSENARASLELKSSIRGATLVDAMPSWQASRSSMSGARCARACAMLLNRQRFWFGGFRRPAWRRSARSAGVRTRSAPCRCARGAAIGTAPAPCVTGTSARPRARRAGAPSTRFLDSRRAWSRKTRSAILVSRRAAFWFAALTSSPALPATWERMTCVRRAARSSSAKELLVTVSSACATRCAAALGAAGGTPVLAPPAMCCAASIQGSVPPPVTAAAEAAAAAVAAAAATAAAPAAAAAAVAPAAAARAAAPPPPEDACGSTCSS